MEVNWCTLCTISDAIYEIINTFFIIHHNHLKRIVLGEEFMPPQLYDKLKKNRRFERKSKSTLKITSDKTFAKYLDELTVSCRVFRIGEEKIKTPVYMESGGTYIESTKGRPMVFYTTQQRLVQLKKNFTDFCSKELDELNKELVEFHTIKKDKTTRKERIKRINSFCRHFLTLQQIVSSVYALGSHWQDFRYVIENYQIQIETRQFQMFSDIIENNKDIFTKVYTQHQLKFLKDNEIYPFKFGKVDYQ
jgi:hypothetical protein